MMARPPQGTNVAAAGGRTGRVCLAGQSFNLDHGGVLIAAWSDQASMFSGIQALDQRLDITVRLAGGALIADLNLQDNLTLEAALWDGSLPRHLIPEMDSLFAGAGCPVDWPVWSSAFPDTAPADAVMQAKIGRALMADPDVLVIDAAQWDDALLKEQAFSRSFARQYPYKSPGYAIITFKKLFNFIEFLLINIG